MLSQWSMSEQDGLLRVASTTSPPFDEAGEQHGEQRELRHRPGARRRPPAPRRAGRRARPRRADLRGPLHRRHRLRRHLPPGRPALRARPLRPDRRRGSSGELKIPGYSAYLHPVGPGLLLGVGRTRRPTAPPGACRLAVRRLATPRTRCALDRESFGAAAQLRGRVRPPRVLLVRRRRARGAADRLLLRRAGGPLGRRAAGRRRPRRTRSAGSPGSPAGPRTAPRSGARSSSAVASTRSRPTESTPTTRRR